MNRRRPRYRAILEISRQLSSRCVCTFCLVWKCDFWPGSSQGKEMGTNFVLTELSLGD